MTLSSLIIMLAMVTAGLEIKMSNIGADELASPVDIVTWDDGFLLLDASLFKVFACDRKGKISPVFGKQGQGPEEFADPIALGAAENRELIYVYDRDRARLFAFDPMGRLQYQKDVKRGTLAQFFPDGLIVHSPLEDALFWIYDLQGNLIGKKGKGLGSGPINPMDTFRYIRHFSIAEMAGAKPAVVATPFTGTDVECYLFDRENVIRNKLHFDFELFTAKQRFSAKENNSFVIDKGQPVLSLQVIKDRLLVLAIDENNREQAHLLVFNHEGHLLQHWPLNRAYRRMKILGTDIALIDSDNAQVDVYSLR